MLPIAPAFSGELAGPAFDSRRLHFFLASSRALANQRSILCPPCAPTRRGVQPDSLTRVRSFADLQAQGGDRPRILPEFFPHSRRRPSQACCHSCRLVTASSNEIVRTDHGSMGCSFTTALTL